MAAEPDDDDALDSTMDDVAYAPGDAADPQSIVQQRIPADILKRYEVHSYRSAAVILAEARSQEFNEILEALRQFTISLALIRRAGGNESEIPKLFSALMRPKNWHETMIQGDLLVRLSWREPAIGASGKLKMQGKSREIRRERFLDGHKIDYVKNRVAFDLEWNSKDQTFDRDLYAFSAFAQCGVIDAAVLVTRSAELNAVFRKLGAVTDVAGKVEVKRDGTPRMISEKYGASTTWMGKLLYRLNAGRNGGCPVLAVGIKPGCISDWMPE